MTEKKSKRTVLITFFVLSAALYLFYLYFSPIKCLKSFQARPYSTEFYDNEGNLLQVSSLENGLRREYTALNEIPDKVIKAFLQSEDKRFYYHKGIDFFSITRAIFQNTIEKRKVSGASTITMQLAKLIYNNEERNLKTKIREIILALRIEKRLSKNQILSLYLNNIPFANNIEGITSASRYYFSKNLKNLDDEEIMFLSIIPRRPNYYNPIKNPEICAKKCSEIFKYPEEKLLQKAENLPEKYIWPFECPHLIESAKKEIDSKKTKCFLTINKDLQNFSEYTLKEALKNASKSRINNGALLVIENSSGKILTWIGSNSWFDKEHSGMIDGVLVLNQMGSSMKPFLYAAALEKKNPFDSEKNLFTPNQILSDIPMEFGSENLYFPRNFNNRYNGPVLFRSALASSLNIPAVFILNEVGLPYYLNYLYSLGFDSLRENGIKNDLALALGSGEVSLLELTSAFSVFARDGIYIKSRYFENQKIESHKVFEKDTARIIADILSDKKARVTGFGYSQTFETKYPSIFKTGTANQFQNIVALGGSVNYTIGVWMGNFSGNTVVGKTGSSLPAKVAKEILDYLNGDDYMEFQKPENYTKVKICSLSGMCPNENCPRTVEEFIKKSEINSFNEKKCFWHQKNEDGKLITVYPAEYESFLSQNHVNSEINRTTSSLKIISPQNNSIFFQDYKSDEQKIPLKIIGGSDKSQHLRIFYDENELYISESKFEVSKYFLPVEKGFHTVKVISGQETDEILFEVK